MNGGLSDLQALINALARSSVEREKAEAIAQSALVENQRLVAQIAELTGASKDGTAPKPTVNKKKGEGEHELPTPTH